MQLLTMRSSMQHPRRAAATVEFALVAPLSILLLIGLLIGGMGAFRFMQVAHLAREASRWAAVHGADYAGETGHPAATPSDVYNQSIVPLATAIDLSQLTYAVTWSTNNNPSHDTTVNGKTVKVSNSVTVTITYHWIPESFLAAINLTSTSVCMMSY